MNIIPIREFCNLTKIIHIHKCFQSIHEYLILLLNIYKEYAYISLWLCLHGKFVQKNESQEKEVLEKI